MSDLAADLVAALADAGATLSTAESLTGGLLGGAVTAVAGSSAVYRGGVVSYATDLKVALLGVPDAVVTAYGVVSAECAEAMATGARARCGTAYALSTTGVAGPDPQDGVAVGVVFLGLAGPTSVTSRRLELSGDRAAVRAQTVAAALGWLLSALSEKPKRW